MMRKREGVYELLGSGGAEVFPRLDVQVRGTGQKILLDGRPLISSPKTHEDLHMDALKRWLQGCDEAFEEWLAE
ncbi:MAG: hypothetical protein ACE5IJ_04815 [Thermoplasmata archaeon]